MQPGDVEATWANIDSLSKNFGYKPKVSIESVDPSLTMESLPESNDSECLSSSSIESFDIVTKNKSNDKYYKKGKIDERKYNESARFNSSLQKHSISSLATDTMSDSSLIETFTESIKGKKNCDKLVNHIMKCKKCRDKLRKKFRPPLVKKINLLFDDNKDLCVLILVGFAILIFMKLIYSICRD